MNGIVLLTKREPSWLRIGLNLMLGMVCICFTAAQAAEAGRAAWFPDQANVPQFKWSYQACEACKAMTAKPEWQTMARLAGLNEVHFMLAPDESNGPAYSVAPNVVVISPSALKLKPCQLSFVIGHEIVHIAQRHFDEDALALAVFEGKGSTWTRNGEKAMELLEGNFGLALKMSEMWQLQEQEADWIGALLAAHACGCNLEQSALAYLVNDEGYGGGLIAAHPESSNRMSFLMPFEESARRLADRFVKTGF